MATNRLDVILSADTRQIVGAFREVGAAAEAGMGAIKSNGATATLALAQLAGGAINFGKGAFEAIEAEKLFGRQLQALTKDAEGAAATLEMAGAISDEFGFDDERVQAATVALTRFKVSAEEFIPQVLKLAEVLGEDVAREAEQFGQALAGNEKAMKALFRTGIVTEEQLIKNGAAFDDHNKIVTEGEENLRRYQQALKASVDESAGDILQTKAESLGASMQRLRNAIDDFKKQFAGGLEGPAKAVTEAITSVVKAFQVLPEGIKSAIATAVTGVVALAGLALAAQTMVAAFTPLVGMLSAAAGAIAAAGAAATTAAVELSVAEAAAIGLTEGLGTTTVAAAGLSTAMTATLGVIGLAAVAAVAYTAVLEEQNKATEALLQTEAKRAHGLGEHHDLMGKTAEEMRKMGATAQDVAEMIQGLQEAQDLARNQGTKEGAALAQRYADEVRRLKEIQSQFADTEAKKRAEIKATEAAQKAAEKRAEEFKKDRSSGVYESKADELAALDGILQSLSKQSEAYRELSRERIRLAREVAKEEQADHEKARKEKLDGAKQEVALLGAQSDQNKQKQIDALRKILETYDLTAQEKMAIEIDVARLQQQVTAQTAAARKKAEEDHKKQIEARAEAEQTNLKSQKEGSDIAIKELEDKLSRGEDVLAQLQAEIDKRTELEKKIKDGETAKAKRANPEQAGQLDKAAAQDKANLDKKGADEKEKLDRQQSEKRKKDAAEETSLAEREAKLREEAERRIHEAGGKNHTQLVRAMKDRQRLEEEALAAKLQADSAGKAGAELERLQRTYNADLLELRQRNTDELRKANQELDKAKQTTKSMTGAVLTLDEFVKQSNEEYAGGPEKSADAPDPKALKAALEAKDKLSQSLGTPGLPPPPKPGQLGYRTPSALTKTPEEPAQQQAGSFSGGDGTGAIVAVLERILAALTQNGKTGSMSTEFSSWSSTPNRCY